MPGKKGKFTCMSESIQDNQRGERRDFPEFVPPLLVKELRQGLRTRGFVMFLILFPLLMSVPFFFYMMLGEDGMSKSVVNLFFWIGLVMVFLLFNPLRALYSVDQEKKTRSDELIMLTHITSYRIVFEKWISFTLQTILLVLIVLPFFLLRYFLGGVDLIPELFIVGIMFFLSCVLTAMGLWVSGMPLLYRVLYGIGLAALVCTAVALTGSALNSTGGNFLSRYLNLWGNRPFLFLMILLPILTGVYILCKGFLLLTSRWFASLSENTSCPLRKLLFGGVAVMWTAFILGFYFNDNGQSSSIGGFVITLIFTSLCPAVFFLLEMILPGQYQFIYVKKLKKKGGLPARFMPLFLPGWQSAGLGFLLFFSVFWGILMMVLCHDATAEEADVERVSRAFCLLIANILFFTVVFRPLYKRTGIHSLICWPVIVSVFWLLSIVLWKAGNGRPQELFSALPMTCFYEFADPKLKEVVTPGNYLFFGLNLLLFILASLPFWKKYRKDKVVLKEQ